MATTISLPQPAYWPQQLTPSVSLSYSIDPPLPTTGNVLAFVPPGGSVSPQYQIPFTPTSGSGTVPIPGTDARVPWSQMPPPNGAYTWTIQLQSPTGTVYATATMQLVPPPILTNLVYSGSSIVAQFVPVSIGSPSYYTLTVVGSAGTLTGRTQTAFQNQIQIPLTTPLTGTATFALATVGSGSLSSSASPAPMFLGQPAVVFSSYDGAKITAQWTAQPGATAYLMRAYSNAGKPPFQGQSAVPQGTLAASNLDASYSFVVYAAATLPVYAAGAPLGFLLPPPHLIAAAYDGGGVTAQCTPVTGAASYSMRAYAAGGPAYQQSFPIPQGRLTAPSLDPALPYKFEILGNATGQVSAATPATPMLLTLPRLMDGLYDGANTIARWLPVSKATGYTLRVYTTGGGPSYEASSPVPQGSVASPSLSLAVPYYFVILANAPGYVSSAIPGAPILTTLPQLQQAGYDLATVQASWTPLTGPMVAGYLLRAYAPGAPTYQTALDQPSQGQGTVTIPSPLDANAPYKFELIARVAYGVASMSQRRMLLRAPGNPALGYADLQRQLIASWTADPEPGVTGYIAYLEKNGAPLQQQSTSGLSYAFAQDLDPGALFRARARATDGVMIGPYSAYGNAPVALVMTSQFDGFGRLTQEQWTLVAQRQTYTYTVDDPGNITAAASAKG